MQYSADTDYNYAFNGMEKESGAVIGGLLDGFTGGWGGSKLGETAVEMYHKKY